jgi:YHS domain-containing protein
MEKTLIYFVSIFLISISSFSQEDIGTRKKHVLMTNGLAIQGYDPVAYFVNKKAVKGKSNLRLTYEGVDYQFSSVVNLDLFKKNPKSFEPCYGGWCAYAMGNAAEKVEVDPETFKIIDNKLYLFYNKLFNNTLKDWNKDEKNLKSNADRNWLKIIIKK